jgi:hypothetical protein
VESIVIGLYFCRVICRTARLALPLETDNV